MFSSFPFCSFSIRIAILANVLTFSAHIKYNLIKPLSCIFYWYTFKKNWNKLLHSQNWSNKLYFQQNNCTNTCKLWIFNRGYLPWCALISHISGAFECIAYFAHIAYIEGWKDSFKREICLHLNRWTCLRYLHYLKCDYAEIQYWSEGY